MGDNADVLRFSTGQAPVWRCASRACDLAALTDHLGLFVGRIRTVRNRIQAALLDLRRSQGRSDLGIFSGLTQLNRATIGWPAWWGEAD